MEERVKCAGRVYYRALSRKCWRFSINGELYCGDCENQLRQHDPERIKAKEAVPFDKEYSELMEMCCSECGKPYLEAHTLSRDTAIKLVEAAVNVVWENKPKHDVDILRLGVAISAAKRELGI